MLIETNDTVKSAESFMKFDTKFSTKDELVKYATTVILKDSDAPTKLTLQPQIEKVVDDYLLQANVDERKQASIDAQTVIADIKSKPHAQIIIDGNVDKYQLVLKDSMEKLGYRFRDAITALVGKAPKAPTPPKAVVIHTGTVAETTYKTFDDFKKKIIIEH